MRTYEVSIFCDTCDTESLCSEPATTPGEGERQVERMAEQAGWDLSDADHVIGPRCKERDRNRRANERRANG